MESVAAELEETEKKEAAVAEQPPGVGMESAVVELGETEGKEEPVVVEKPPDWLPDGWIMEVRRGNNGSIYRYYTSPVSGYTFSKKLDVMQYLVAEVDERVVESQACAEASTLHSSHKWLPAGWVIEIRAGGKKLDKMYKCYAHVHSAVRLFSKEEVLCYLKEGRICSGSMNRPCDTSSEDKILSQLEFNPDGLPEGWLKETTFRKYRDGIRKDPYYTDPVSHSVFRTLRDAVRYLETGERSKNAYIPRRSVMDLYSFDESAVLPPRFFKRLKRIPKEPRSGDWKGKSRTAPVIKKELSNEQNSSHYTEGGISTCPGPNSKLKQKKPRKRKLAELKTVNATGKANATSDTIKRPRGRPRKILKQTNASMSEHAESSHHEAEKRHIVVPWEVKSEIVVELELLPEPEEKISEASGKEQEGLKPIKNAKETEALLIRPTEINMAGLLGSSDSESEMEKNVVVNQEMESKSNPHLHEQENGKPTQNTEKILESPGSPVHKVYRRRSCLQVPGLKQETTCEDHLLSIQPTR